MKKLFFLFTVFAAVATVSCTRDDVRGVASVSEGEPVTLRVGVSTLGTRADDGTGLTDDWSDSTVMSESEAKVNRLQVFVFTQDGGLERSEYDGSGESFVKLTCFAGTKEVVAVVNAPEEINWLEVSSLEDFKVLPTYLEENDFGDFFMYGSETVDISPDGDTNIDIEVSRRVARVVLKSVTNNVKHNGIVGDLCLESAYLINVAGESKYGYSGDYASSTWYNKSALFDGDLTSAPYSFLYNGITDFDEPLGDGESYDEIHTFYCYPNTVAKDEGDSETEDGTADEGAAGDDEWIPHATRLVVEASLNGRPWYYPVTINEILPNHSYEIDLTIEGAGSDSPDSEPRNTNYTFTVTVADWEVTTIPAEI